MMTDLPPKKPRKRKRKKPTPPIVVTPPQTIDYPGFGFDILHKDPNSRARIGKLTTPHGTIETPNYIFCGTKAAIKGLSPAQMKEAGTDIILANTYHLLIQPGSEHVEKMGQLHQFMQWDGPMMTDSGGFQVFSLQHGGVADEVKGRNRGSFNKSLKGITEEGAAFRSYRDGRLINLTPESAIHAQRQLGADLIYQFDECTAYHDSQEYTGRAMERTHRWGDRCLVEFEKGQGKYTQALFGITQGGIFEDLRKQSRDYVMSRPFFGTAIGGCLGGTEEEMYSILDWSAELMALPRPVHFLGIGRIRDVFAGVRRGVDTFDCVTPTRIARHGTALMKGVKGETINLGNAKYKDDPEPLAPWLDIPASRDFSKAYIHHLFKAGELLGMQIVAQHNVALINALMRGVRQAIRAGTLDEIEKEWVAS